MLWVYQCTWTKDTHHYILLNSDAEHMERTLVILYGELLLWNEQDKRKETRDRRLMMGACGEERRLS